MTHQVLARKWRPHRFSEVVGQTPIVRALTNALDQNRLHHAYLFTGTRGVGKTSIARLLAKCVNCQQGVSSSPCGECGNCQANDEGRFLDLLEVDAASRTKIEDTRDLLDNVQYAPTQGKYKVYLIDEVHMLSNHSFNALLKTLEEPPAHVIFLLATTDAQKLPVTVLSRCLQFHLKNLSAAQIGKQLAHILTAENIRYEVNALADLAYAAQGSMRDALSLLDQAIAYTDGIITLKEIKDLLGATEPELLLSLLADLIKANGIQLLKQIDYLAELGIDFQHALEELLSILHQIALTQIIPDAVHESHYDVAKINEFAKMMSPEELQLYYQIALMGRKDLPLAPTPRGGFEMILLRMLAFRPQDISIAALLGNHHKVVEPIKNSPKTSIELQPKAEKVNNPSIPSVSRSLNLIKHDGSSTHLPAAKIPEPWTVLLSTLKLQGAAAMLATHSRLIEQTDDSIRLGLSPDHTMLLNKITESQIATALEKRFSKPMRLIIETDAPNKQTPAMLDKHEEEQKKQHTETVINNDRHLKQLLAEFNGKIIPNSIRTKETDSNH